MNPHFNSHPHEEDDNITHWSFLHQLISTHILTKRMTSFYLFNASNARYFNSHPHEEDDSLFYIYSSLLTYFNSHPHEEDDYMFFSFIICMRISTHILTKRMTLTPVILSYASNISTHILTKRMTAILNKNNLFKIAYYISNKHFISIVDIFFHFHIYF